MHCPERDDGYISNAVLGFRLVYSVEPTLRFQSIINKVRVIGHLIRTITLFPCNMGTMIPRKGIVEMIWLSTLGTRHGIIVYYCT
mgnify:CR=1 FL=1